MTVISFCRAFRCSSEQASRATSDERGQLLAERALSRLDAGEVEDVVDDPEQMLAARMDVVEIGLVGLVADRPEHLAAHQVGEAENGVERRAQLVAHRGQELRLRHVGRLGAPPRLVGHGLRLLELGEDRVLLGAVGEAPRVLLVEMTRQIEEEDFGGQRAERDRDVEEGRLDDVDGRHAERDRQRAGDRRRRDRRGEQRADRKHHDDGGEPDDGDPAGHLRIDARRDAGAERSPRRARRRGRGARSAASRDRGWCSARPSRRKLRDALIA